MNAVWYLCYSLAAHCRRRTRVWVRACGLVVMLGCGHGIENPPAATSSSATTRSIPSPTAAESSPPPAELHGEWVSRHALKWSARNACHVPSSERTFTRLAAMPETDRQAEGIAGFWWKLEISEHGATVDRASNGQATNHLFVTKSNGHIPVSRWTAINGGWRCNLRDATSSKSFDVRTKQGVLQFLPPESLDREPDARPKFEFVRKETAWKVFIVHGTYGGTAEWLKTPEKSTFATFASEVQRGLEPFKCVIEPYYWNSSIHHDVRMSAAAELANRINEAQNDGYRVVLIGHSHGGNVCLAATGLCQRVIDSVICLGTPHILLTMVHDRNKQVSLPVYCTPDARGRVRRIITISGLGDEVVKTWAEIRKGVSDSQAASATYEWQKDMAYPRLVYDSGPVAELFEDVLGERMVDAVSVSAGLSIADSNVYLPSELIGEAVHSQLHSCRVGYLLGNLIADGFSEESLEYLSSLVLAADLDSGETCDRKGMMSSYADQTKLYEHSGWLLDSITVQSASTKRQNGGNWDVDGSWPDLMITVKSESAVSRTSRTDVDATTVTWRPMLHCRSAEAFSCLVEDRDLLAHDAMGDPFGYDSMPQEMTNDEFKSPNFAASLTWRKAHY